MRRPTLVVLGLGLLALVLACGVAFRPSHVESPTWTQSPLAFDEDAGLLIVAHRDASRVVALTAATGRKAWETEVGRGPRFLDLAASGRRREVLVSCAGSGEVWRLDARTGRVRDRLAVGANPRGFALVGGRYLAVALYPLHRLAVWDLESRRRVASVDVPWFPTAVRAAPQEEILYVGHFYDGKITVVDTRAWKVKSHLQADAKTNQVSALAVGDRGRSIFIPHVITNNELPELHLANTVFPVVSVLDTATRAAKRLDLAFIDTPVSGPEALAVLPRRGVIIAVNSRSDDLSLIHRESSLAAGHLEVGRFPLGIVVERDEARAFVANTFEHTISAIDLASLKEMGRFRYGEEVLPPNLARGRDLFNNANTVQMVLNQWIVCSNCHPDGHSDGRVWKLPGKPPLRTKDLHGLASTLPAGWLASQDEMHDEEVFIRDFMLGNGLSPKPPYPKLGKPNTGLSKDLDALSDYVYSLRFEPSPYLENGRLSTAAERGRRLFESAAVGCATCHPAPYYTVSRLADNPRFAKLLEPDPTPLPPVDVPSLLGVYMQPRLLHDARARRPREVFARWNQGDRHGRTSGLGRRDLDDLDAFLLSLPFEEPRRPAGGPQIAGAP
jgi:DNA-binding beta-propeller fold protein YncE